MSTRWRLVLLGAPAAALALCAPAAHADGDLYVTFQANHTIVFAQASGAPVGTTSGAPTVIPAGSYTIHFEDSVGVEGPAFHLQGPGVDLAEDLFFGEAPSATHRVNLLPSSTYTWRNDEQPGVVFTFVTSTASVGGPAPITPSSGGTTAGTPSKDIVGSEIVPFRGALDAIVSKAGKLTLVRAGRAVSRLKSGRYTFSVDDESGRAGFTVQQLRRAPVAVTGVRFVGAHNLTLTLRPGQWYFYSPGGARHYFIVVG
ncbi:MAG TPA: hypothetical protein VFB42_14645 [Gaiellaceae bacterium]|nr:hypothetical protein [Gaiellaceae bacterium]